VLCLLPYSFPSMTLSTRMCLLLTETSATRQWQFNVSDNVEESFSKHYSTANNPEPCFSVWNPERASKHSSRLFREHPLSCLNPASQCCHNFHHSRRECLTSSSEKDPSLILFPSSLTICLHPSSGCCHAATCVVHLLPLRPNVCLGAFASSRQSCSANSPPD
jgi:hypothetical protein